jgi:hypothetical protein
MTVAAVLQAQNEVSAASSKARELHALQAAELANLWAATSDLEARLEALVKSCGVERAVSREDVAMLRKVSPASTCTSANLAAQGEPCLYMHKCQPDCTRRALPLRAQVQA